MTCPPRRTRSARSGISQSAGPREGSPHTFFGFGIRTGDPGHVGDDSERASEASRARFCSAWPTEPRATSVAGLRYSTWCPLAARADSDSRAGLRGFAMRVRLERSHDAHREVSFRGEDQATVRELELVFVLVAMPAHDPARPGSAGTLHDVVRLVVVERTLTARDDDEVGTLPHAGRLACAQRRSSYRPPPPGLLVAASVIRCTGPQRADGPLRVEAEPARCPAHPRRRRSRGRAQVRPPRSDHHRGLRFRGSSARHRRRRSLCIETRAAVVATAIPQHRHRRTAAPLVLYRGETPGSWVTPDLGAAVR